MKKISATVSGEHPKIDVYDPHKELSKDVKKVLDLEKVKVNVVIFVPLNIQLH